MSNNCETIADIADEMHYGLVPKHWTDHGLLTLFADPYVVQDANSEYGPKTSVTPQFIIEVAKPATIGIPDSAKEETAEAKPYHVTVHCDNTGIKVKGARTDIGSTCDTDASSLANFLRIAEYWWHTYCKEARND